MNDPDWNRYVLPRTGQGGVKLGDPTQWGATVLAPLTAAGGVYTTEQIISASTADGYSRNWALAGALRLPSAAWEAPGGWPFPAAAPPFPLSVVVLLDVRMGVGQILVRHLITLMAGQTSNQFGLCNQQYGGNGGPYCPAPEPPIPPSLIDEESRPFAAIGALIGHTVNIRASYIYAPGVPGLPTTSKLDVVLTAFAAGEGL